jgi:hypothetical protein
MKLPVVALFFAGAPTVWAAPDQFDVYVANIEILQAKPVQAELKISDAQRAALNKHADWYNGQTKKVVDQLKASKGTDADRQKGMSQVSSLQQQLKNKVIGELSSWQVKRLGQISLQQAGIVALLDSKVAKKVGMTDAQVKKLRAGWEASGKLVAEAETKARQPVFNKYKDKQPKDEKEAKELSEAYSREMEAASKALDPVLAKAKKDFEALVDSTLTPGQKKAWGDLKGSAFRAL